MIVSVCFLNCSLFLRHVSDVARAFDVIIHNGAIGETYNIGTNSERAVIDVANDICVHFNLDPLKSIEYVSDRLFNDRRYALSVTGVMLLS